jgi:CubicO group peptidase (beta-lactamase class C family)
MDRPLEKPRNTPWRRFRRYALLTVGLFALVCGIGALPLAFVYFAARFQLREAASNDQAGRDPASQMARQATSQQVTPSSGAKVISKSESRRNRYPSKTWEKVETPEDLGWSSEKLQQARQLADSFDTAAVMIIEDGLVIAEWGETARKFNVHSIRKSFLSALYGLAVNEAKINLNSTLAELGIDDNEPTLTAEVKKARVIDLLKARSGIYHLALYEDEQTRAMKPKRGSHPPGSFWCYNNWDFNALGTIFENAMKSTIAEEFNQRIAAPLQMEDFKVEDVQYVRGPDSVHPAYPFRMTARDMARFGLLFLREGEWRGKQVLPKEWVTESTRVSSLMGGDEGYGYMWWVTIKGKNHFPYVQLKAGAFSARGAGGHFIVIIPDRKLVIVHRVNTDISGKQVSGEQFGALLKLILEAKR